MRLKTALNGVILIGIVAGLVTCSGSAAQGLAIFIPDRGPVIAKGDPLLISGATDSQDPLEVWILGRYHFEVKTLSRNRNGEIAVLIPEAATAQWESGPLFVLIHQPGENGRFEITGNDTGGMISVREKESVVFSENAGSFDGYRLTELAGLLERLQGRPGMDDSFSVLPFFLEEPSVHFDRETAFFLEGYHAGGPIRITGTTTIAPHVALTVRVIEMSSGNSVLSGRAVITRGTDANVWGVTLDGRSLLPEEYVITAGRTDRDRRETSTALLPLTGANGAGPVDP
jgi:hypothetical protein